MKYWSRDDTKEWINQLEHRVDDIDYYLDRTLAWCDEYGVYDEKTVFMCSFLTCIWVSQVRGEPITFTELMEMLGVKEWETNSDNEEKIYVWGQLRGESKLRSLIKVNQPKQQTTEAVIVDAAVPADIFGAN
jgi:hypothetical protein